MNQCDGCTACCTALEVRDIILIKPAGKTCPFVCKTGCSIYDNRPLGCHGYDCVYILEEDTPLELRPDKTGVLFEKATTRIYLALIQEERLNDWDTELIRNYIKKLNDGGISVVLCSYKHGLMDVFVTSEHDPDKVVEITMGLANKWSHLSTAQT